MKRIFNNSLIFSFYLVFLSHCAQQESPPSYPAGLPNGTSLAALTGNNVLPMTVNGTTCAAGSYFNKPCVNIQICSYNSTSDCITLTDILVDTGSVGLRVFSSLLTGLNLQPVTDGSSHPYAECVLFGDSSSNWGPIKLANVVLGGESAVQIPIQVIDSTYNNIPSKCQGANVDAASAGYHGILGVGLDIADCGYSGTNCSDSNSALLNPNYYTCAPQSGCQPSKIPLSKQALNPVSQLTQDNNGVILELPLIPFGGQNSAQGYLVLGIGTQTNNQPTGVNSYSADPVTNQFTTQFNGSSLSSFVDSGTNTYAFPGANGLTDCGSQNSQLAGFFCPSSVQSLTTKTTAFSGGASALVNFFVGNAYNLFTSPNNQVFLETGSSASNQFALGLPFFLGRNVYVGFLGKNATISNSTVTGPYWAY
jgi:Protein of unknown function (DUF3443)